MHLARLPVLLLVAALAFPAPAARAQSVLSDAFAATNAGLSPEEAAGREIWMFATAFNDRFFTYSYPQRIGGAIDWYEFLRADRRGDLFDAWGAIPDPDCCAPGDPDCPARSPTETYGLLWCPGDDELLASVGREGYVDPACGFADAPFDASTPHGAVDQRQSACDLRFGTSTGALGFRKFPNPRFDAAAWERIGGWEGYAAFLSDDPADPDSRLNRLWDGSVEPPVRIGMACGACHIAYDPLNPPADPDHPRWENIDALVGNQYSRVSNLLGNGLSPHRLEWQLIARARPGIVDTSALPMDYVSNPGTMNAIINFARRPTFAERVLKWRKASACEPGADPRACWCEPGKPGKCWLRSEMVEPVPHILKGGEDSIGFEEAIQRVYFNIGSCAEQCWVNHLTDLRAADPYQRNHGQTPFDIGQCRRDCASFRAIEDRLGDLLDFFLTARPTDLWRARGLSSPEELEAMLDAEHLPGAVERGREVFAANCARCHSSQPGPYETVDFLATDPDDPTLRLDWLGSDEVVPASEIGTYAARSLHANHMEGRVWAEYASLDAHARPADPVRPEVMKGGGRGYYRNVSLLSAWAHAPFMHNNAIGPEILRRAGGRGGRILLVALRRRRGGADRRCAGVPGVRSERRGAVRALRGVDGGAAEPGQAGAEGVRARRGHRDRHRAGGGAVRARHRADADDSGGVSGGRCQLAALQGPDPGPGARRARSGEVRAEVCDAADRAAAAGAARGARGDPGGADRDGVAVGDRAGARARGGGGRAGAGADTAGRQRVRAALLFERARPRRERRARVRRGALACGQGRPDGVPRDALREGRVERTLRVLVAVALLVAVAYAALWAVRIAGFGYLLSASQQAPEPVRPELPFAPLVDTSLADPDNPTQVFHVDLARVEQEFPLTRAELAALGPENLVALNQEEVDQLYARLTAGPIPDGAYLGELFFARGESMAPRLQEILGGLEGRLAAEKIELAEGTGRALWKGKLFYRDDRVLRNFIEDFRSLEGLVDDPGALEKVEVPREGWLRHVMPTTDVWLLFPAKLYCGQSLLDGRRESVIIDYAFNDDLPGYQENPDALAGRNGLRVRDEIRMVRPGSISGGPTSTRSSC